MSPRGPHKMRLVANQVTRLICRRYATTFGIYPLIEYPKCGGTWLCRMLADTMQLPFAQFSSLPVAMPSIVHGHWGYHKGYKNVTFLMRDGRDVMVSFYFHYARDYKNPRHAYARKAFTHLYGDSPDLSDVRANLPRFIEHLSKDPVGAPADWSTYHDRWTDKPGVVYTRYEALRADCVAEMTRIAGEHGFSPEPWRVERAVEGNSMERTAGRKPGQEDRSSFIRKGVVGDWKNHFSEDSLRVFAELCGQTLVRLGYEDSPDWRDWDATPGRDPHAGPDAEPDGPGDTPATPEHSEATP